MKISKYIILIAISMVMVACGSKKNLESTATSSIATSVDNASLKKVDYIRRVHDNAVTPNIIVSKIDFEIDAMGKNISVDGKIFMRKDEVIRIVLSPLGIMEVGRVEFTPDYVLVVDRLHKQYVKASYNDLDFLKNNGLTFYSLQALFWNELFLPGNKKLTDELLVNFDTNMSEKGERKVTTKSGSLNFEWNTTTANARINSANVNYGAGTSKASSATWKYDSFSVFASKQYPTSHALTFASKSVKSNTPMKVNIKMKKLTTDPNWETLSKVSEKYTQVNAEEALKKLIQF